MEAKKTQTYVVTAINKLTRERDIISPQCSYDKGKEAIKKFIEKSHKDSAYLYPRLEVYNPVIKL